MTTYSDAILLIFGAKHNS